ncbi:substrate-binding domain-containing protein [Thermogemmatispora onikobensis]|uniref:substrate-binding domain-containing protein n=1 Tax=Thermogemmatispora onikobensis TaxID=732234 RepID=UPI0008533C07|nr:substrate-binding domain-containing protein [Thermogemmatispora onikobensis]
MQQRRLSRRDFLQTTSAVSLAALLSGCFGVGGQSGGSSNSQSIVVWDISNGNDQKLIQDITAKFNQTHSSIHATVQFFQNDPYKQKLQVAMGAHQPPDIFFGWGGGILKSYIDAGDVYDLTPDLNADPAWRDRFLPSSLGAATFNNHIYGIPNDGVQPVVFLYNKDIFAKYKLSIPQTWGDLLALVKTVKQQGLQPIALGGASKWTYLMYEMYLVDRLGGPQVFDAIMANQPNAWSNPAIIKANTMIQDLVAAGAFGSGFASVSYDTGQASALLYTGKAAMHLMGTWDFGTITNDDPAFIQQGKLGWFPFPAVEGGVGDPSNLTGVPCNYYSVAKTSKAIQACVTYLKDAVLNDEAVDRRIALGEIPPVKGIENKLSNAPHSDWLLFVYRLVQKAAHFQLAWDQALPPQPAQALLTNLDQLFLRQISPQQFSANMNQTIGT